MTEFLNAKATTDLIKNRLVTYATNDGELKYAESGDFIAGVTAKGAKQNEQADYTACGFAEVELGGTVTKGDALTAGTDGKAVVADNISVESEISDTTITNTVTSAKIIGYATVSGVSGDIIRIIIDRR